MIKAVQAVVGLGLLCFAATQVAVAQDISKLPRVKQERLVEPPVLV